MLPDNGFNGNNEDPDGFDVDVNEMDAKRIAKLEEAGLDERDILDEAKHNMNGWQAYFNENLSRGKADADFVFRDQWEKQERNSFALYQKPAMTRNKLRPVMRKIVGEQRKNKPDLIVRSLTGKATEEEIDLRADMVRSISYQSQVDLIYQAAFNSSLSRGHGAFQIGIEYENPYSFKQVIRYHIINDVTQTSFDPTAEEPHKGDGNFYSRNYQVNRKEFHVKYPWIKNPVSYSDPNQIATLQWVGADEPLITCDYFHKRWEAFTLYMLSNNMMVTKEQWDAMQEDLRKRGQIAKDALILGGLIEKDIPHITGERMSQRYKIMQFHLLQNTIIDFTLWPSKYLPGIFVDGDSQYLDGQQYTTSFVHDAKDAQRSYNYTTTEIMAEIKNRRKEQWLATPANTAGYDYMWRNPELQMGALVANPDPKTGGMPQKIAPWDLSPAMLQVSQQASQDIREILGFAEADTMGSRDISGKAKQQRRLDASESTYVYHDNLNQAIAQGGRVVLDLLPVIYSDERGFVVTKQDGATKNVTLNKKLGNGKVENALERGDFDIEIDSGPSFAVQKEVSLELLMGLVQANPAIFPMVADLIAKNLDVQFRPQIEERFKNFVPPEILAKEAGEPPPPPKPNPQEEMMHLEQQVQIAQLQEREHELEIRKEQHALDKEKHEIDRAKLFLELSKLKAQINESVGKGEIENKKMALNYDATMSKIAADIQKEHVKNNKRTKSKE